MILKRAGYVQGFVWQPLSEISKKWYYLRSRRQYGSVFIRCFVASVSVNCVMPTVGPSNWNPMKTMELTRTNHPLETFARDLLFYFELYDLIFEYNKYYRQQKFTLVFATYLKSADFQSYHRRAEFLEASHKFKTTDMKFRFGSTETSITCNCPWEFCSVTKAGHGVSRMKKSN